MEALLVDGENSLNLTVDSRSGRNSSMTFKSLNGKFVFRKLF